MAISGTYYLRVRMPHPSQLIADVPPDAPAPSAPPSSLQLKEYAPLSKGFFEGEITLSLEPMDDGTLRGSANGEPINSGYYTGDDYFAVEYPAGPASWAIWARVDTGGYVEGVVCLGNCMGRRAGFPNLVYGKKIEETDSTLSQ